jgi:amidase
MSPVVLRCLLLLCLAALSVPTASSAAVQEQTQPFDVRELTIAQIRKGLREHRFTAEGLTKAYLAQIERFEPAYHAFTFMNSRALERAREIDKKGFNGEGVGPLAGVPIVVKESMNFVGLPSTAGWAPLSSRTGGLNVFPVKNATVVQRMVSAGAIVLGKTNIPAFSDDNTRANSSWDGPTYNAINRRLAPGGSSSGTATAVAAGFAPGGLAEETGGSIQSPSAAQSLVGIKPTFALVPTSGVVPLAGSTRDVVGPIATNVRDAALILDVIAGYSPDDPKTIASIGHIPKNGYTSRLRKDALRGKRLGLYGRGWRLADLSDETSSLYQEAIKELKAQGATLVGDPFAASGFAELALPNQPYDFRGTESAAYDYTNYLKSLGVKSIDALRDRIHVAPFDNGAPLHYYTDLLPVLRESLNHPDIRPDLSEFNRLRESYLRIFNHVMRANHLDALVFPQATESIPALFSDTLISETTVSPLNIAGLPGVTVPAGQYRGTGAPFSLIFIGRPWSEADLLGLAYDYEQATHHRIRARLSID